MLPEHFDPALHRAEVRRQLFERLRLRRTRDSNPVATNRAPGERLRSCCEIEHGIRGRDRERARDLHGRARSRARRRPGRAKAVVMGVAGARLVITGQPRSSSSFSRRLSVAAAPSPGREAKRARRAHPSRHGGKSSCLGLAHRWPVLLTFTLGRAVRSTRRSREACRFR